MDDAIPAATLIVVRERPSGPPDLLMVERSEGMAFAAGALVFPGGRIDAADQRIAPGKAAAVAAVRETIEETAVPAGLARTPDRHVALELQSELARDGDFAALLSRAGLELDLGALTPFARWVPKFHAVRRFDTMFFVASCPPGAWRPNVIERECAGAHWM